MQCRALPQVRQPGSQVLGITSSFSGIELLAAGADWTASDLANLPQELEELLAAAGV